MLIMYLYATDCIDYMAYQLVITFGMTSCQTATLVKRPRRPLRGAGRAPVTPAAASCAQRKSLFMGFLRPLQPKGKNGWNPHGVPEASVSLINGGFHPLPSQEILPAALRTRCRSRRLGRCPVEACRPGFRRCCLMVGESAGTFASIILAIYIRSPDIRT